jgi:hypothetical protein
LVAIRARAGHHKAKLKQLKTVQAWELKRIYQQLNGKTCPDFAWFMPAGSHALKKA